LVRTCQDSGDDGFEVELGSEGHSLGSFEKQQGLSFSARKLPYGPVRLAVFCELGTRDSTALS
jgi:hypothetical protein